MSTLFLNPASNGLHHHSYDPMSAFSTDYADLDCSICAEVYPSDNFNKFHGEGLVRMAPQVFPPFGKTYIKTAAFFVPAHQLIEYSDAFMMNMSTYKGQSIGMPQMSAYDINLFFAANTNMYGGKIGEVTNPTDPDLQFPDPDLYDYIKIKTNVNNDIIWSFYQLNSWGRRVYKVLKSLGYDFASPTFRSTDSYQDLLDGCNQKVNILPLLAYCKIYTDMFLNGVQYNGNNLVYLLHCIHDNESCVISGTTYYNNSTHLLSIDGLKLIFDNIKLPHEQNMFSEAWNTPNSPDGTNPSGLSFGNNQGPVSPYLTQGTNSPDQLAAGSSNTAIQDHSQGYLRNITAFGLRLLQSFDKFVRRWNLAGTKAVQRVYASFGIKSDDFNSHFVHKLYEGSELIKFYPVLSNADTVSGSNGQGLGDYAGFASPSLSFDFDYKSSDFGYILVLHWLQVKPMIMRGLFASVLKRYPFDFYTPELDGKAVRPIPSCELSVLKPKVQTGSSAPSKDVTVFGFTNLNDDLRFMRDNVFGDFVGAQSKRAFIFARDYSVIRDSAINIHPQQDDIQYYGATLTEDMSDPFQMSRSAGDRFWIFINFDIEAERPMLSETDAFDLNGSGDVEVRKNGVMLN